MLTVEPEKSGAYRSKIVRQFDAENARRALAQGRVVHGPEPGTSSSRNFPFLEPERFGIHFPLAGTGTGIPKSQINFCHERFFAVN